MTRQTPSTYPPYVNTGTPIIRKTLRPGDTFEISGYNSVYRVMDILDGYQKILRYDGWIVRCYFDNEVMDEVVYKL